MRTIEEIAEFIENVTNANMADNELAETARQISNIIGDIPIDRIEEICNAEREGKLDISEYTRCKRAEKTADGKCLGYKRSWFDDEPSDKCKECKNNVFYEEGAE